MVAAPGMADERFKKSVVFIYQHDKNGACGIVVNKPNDMMNFQELCAQLNFTADDAEAKYVLYDGGPVDCNRGFVLHSDDFTGRDTKNMEYPEAGTICLTTTVDIIKRMASGKGPKNALVSLGCAVWGPGQLDSELTRHGWLLYPADQELIFTVPYMLRWETVIERMGANLGGLAEYSGSA